MLVWLPGARLHAGRSAVPFDGADAAWLEACDVAASFESRTLVLLCTLQLASSLVLAPHALAWPLAPCRLCMMLCQCSVPCSKH